MSEKKFQQWIDTALSHRAKASSLEVAYYSHLVEGEKGACPWQQAGYACFEDVLRKYHLADVARYHRFYSATLMFGDSSLKRARKLGIDAVIVGAGIADEAQREQFLQRLEELTAVRPHGAPLTLEEIKRIRKDIVPARTQVRTDKPRSIGLPEDLRLDLERLVVDLRKTGSAPHASALALQFIRDGIARCRQEMGGKRRGRAA